MKRILQAAMVAAAFVATPAGATEIFGGVYAHAVNTPFTLDSRFESGVDIQAGIRGGSIIPGTGLQPYAFGAINSSGDTNYAAAGLSWKFGDRIFIRPGLGIGIHDGSAGDFRRTDRIAFGSRVLFAPELGVGVRVNDRMTVEASWVHLSNGTLLSDQNPGIDNIGARLSLKL